jgi:hypothetical protein
MGCEESVLQSFLTTSMFSGCRTVAIKGQQKRSAGDLRLDAYGEEPKTETVDKDDRVRFGQLTLRSPAFRDPQQVANALSHRQLDVVRNEETAMDLTVTYSI